ncbi:MAG: hypothetical protein J6332_06580, partial [Abditibacteriota bacterium]|nr:hypothetical protein [Abditibacteriota bacterium]
MSVTPREKFIRALERKPITGLVPHFELVFFLTMETLGKVHPCHRNYFQWDQMSEYERNLHREDMADLYIATAERFDHNAIFIHSDHTESGHIAEIIREKTGDKYYITMHGDPTYPIPDGEAMLDFCYRMSDDSQGMKDEAQRRVDEFTEKASELAGKGLLDGFTLCSDYCLNTGPFLSPAQFDEFVMPYLTQIIKNYREMGFYTIKHTDGNIMPIIDRLVEA